jgi:hypothetical protein
MEVGNFTQDDNDQGTKHCKVSIPNPSTVTAFVQATPSPKRV